MTYELANELKDAGFPQTGKSDEHFYPKGSATKDHERIYAPTLSELIEACGEGFAHLVNNDGGWSCNWGEKDYPTPEEAVARLWLALNKK